jgi:hypothetical protein
MRLHTSVTVKMSSGNLRNMHLAKLLRHAGDTRLSGIGLLIPSSGTPGRRRAIVLAILILLGIRLLRLLAVLRLRGRRSGLLLLLLLGKGLAGRRIGVLLLRVKGGRGIKVVLLRGIRSPSSPSRCAGPRLLLLWPAQGVARSIRVLCLVLLLMIHRSGCDRWQSDCSRRDGRPFLYLQVGPEDGRRVRCELGEAETAWRE